MLVHNPGKQAMADELPRPPEAPGSGSGGSIADEAGVTARTGKQIIAVADRRFKAE